MWFGFKPDVSHLRVFGCIAFAKTNSHLGKFEPRSTKCVMVGYSEVSKAWRLFDVENSRLIVSRDVIFLESKRYFTAVSVGVQIYQPSDSVKLSERVDDQNEIQNEVDENIDDAQEQKIHSDNLFQNQQDLPDDLDPEIASDEEYQPSENILEQKEPAEPIPQVFPRRSQRLADSAPQPEPQAAVRRSTRQTTAPVQWWKASPDIERADLVNSDRAKIELEPQTYSEAVNSSDGQKWKEAIDEEYKSLIDNETWELVPRPAGRNIVSCKWVFKTKLGSDGQIDRYKARLVARGFTQVEGIDYQETYSPVVKMTSIRILLSLVAIFDLELHQMDVKTAFLNGKLDEEIYMQQPEG
ncbi:MAG: reverse transcriptase domain-containing protein, partial [bacterium]